MWRGHYRYPSQYLEMWPSQSHKNLFDTATSRSLLGMWGGEPGFARKNTRWNFKESTLIIDHAKINCYCTRWRCLLQHVSSTQRWSFRDFWFLSNNVFEAEEQQQNKTVRQLLLVRNIYWLWYCTLHCKTLNYVSSLTKRHLCTNTFYTDWLSAENIGSSNFGKPCCMISRDKMWWYWSRR